MNNKFIGELPQNYHPSKDWRLLPIALVTLLASFDMIYFPLIGEDILIIITSGILLLFFIYELIFRIKFKQTKLGYNLSLYLVIAYVVSDLLIYFGM
jgi:glycopeptide antibiotics resistance protein